MRLLYLLALFLCFFCCCQANPIKTNEISGEHEILLEPRPRMFLDNASIPQGTGKFCSVNFTDKPALRWPSNTVPVEIRPDFKIPDLRLMFEAMQEIERKTCIRFIQRTTEKDYVSIVSQKPCSSNVGRIGGPQKVLLDRLDCMRHDIIVHELMHALGVYHEQDRKDRDKYVEILWKNIPEGYQYAFETTYPAFGEYDYYSIMHYKTTYNNITFFKILDSKIDVKKVGFAKHMSALDAKGLNHLYGCK